MDKPKLPLRLPNRRRKLFVGLAVALTVLVVSLASFAIWFNAQLQPVDKNSQSSAQHMVEIKAGVSFSQIAADLKQRGLIRNAKVFEIYAKSKGKQSAVKAGSCKLKPSETAAQILDKITTGCHDFVSITFYPGATIEKPLYKPAGAVIDQTMYVKYRLSKAGFTDQQITAALGKTYDSPLFAGKPAGTTLEGYVFGETYYVATDASAETVLKMTFDHMYQVIQQNDLEAAFKKQGLTLYQGITLASIVQRELNCEDKPTAERKERCYQYQRTIAQVFLSRLKQGISLGSDVTFIYAADMLGVAPTVDLDSNYNTRIHTGLTPGPIASPGLLALKAVADPSLTDNLFFLAGDDGLIYFAEDQAGHEQNIIDHCKVLCAEL